MPNSSPIDLSKSINYDALKDKNILITGGASGFGKAFVELFVSKGANVVIADVQDVPGKDLEQQLTSSGGKVKFVQTDVSKFESQVNMLRQALEFFPRNEVDCFIPCAGVLEHPTQINPQDPAGLADLTSPPADMKSRIISINLAAVFTGVLLVSRYGMGLHKADKSGVAKSIVLIASLAGYCGAEGSVEYTTSKFGVRGILRGLRKQMATLNVRLNSVNAFYVETPMTADAAAVLKQVGIPLAPISHVVEATTRLVTDEDAWGRAVFVMPEGLSDGGDDAAGGEGGRSFSVDKLGEHWAVLVNGPMSDTIPA